MFFSIPRFPWFNLSLSFKSNSLSVSISQAAEQLCTFSTPVSECCSPRKTLSRSVKIISVNLCDFCNPGWWKMFAEVKRKLHIRQLIELFTSCSTQLPCNNKHGKATHLFSKSFFLHFFPNSFLSLYFPWILIYVQRC